jgi:hypothetical protein
VLVSSHHSEENGIEVEAEYKYRLKQGIGIGGREHILGLLEAE